MVRPNSSKINNDENILVHERYASRNCLSIFFSLVIPRPWPKCGASPMIRSNVGLSRVYFISRIAMVISNSIMFTKVFQLVKILTTDAAFKSQ